MNVAAVAAPPPTVAQESAGSPQVLYVQPSARQRFAVAERLARLGTAVVVGQDIAEALRLLTERRFALVIVDLAHDRAALTALRLIRSRHATVALVGVVDPANPAIAAEALHAGVTDLLPWPFESQDIALLIANARDRGNAEQLPALAAGSPPDALVTQSDVMRQVLDQMRTAARSRQNVCVSGERATGRRLVAHTIHALGGAAEPLFVVADCATTSPHELEAHLFGAGSDGRDAGAPRAAAERLTADSAMYRATGGTLFLPNLLDAPARVQARLARLLRDREAALPDRRGVVELDVRAIASIDGDVEGAVADGRLRRDLADRLCGIRIDMPSLRARREDIPLLVVAFVRRLCEEQQVPVKVLSRSALALLAALPWPGNASELRGVLEALVRSVRANIIQLEDVLEYARLDGMAARIDTSLSLREAKARFERECISAVLLRHHGRVGEAAKALGIQRTNLYRKVRQLNVSRTLLSARR
ncbi:MAG: sigma 54-interacting transcriptional regulator [Vicinamibacterales bacterium]